MRCIRCGSTLLFQEIETGSIEIMCRQTRCKVISRLVCEKGRCSITYIERKITNFASQKENMV